MLLLCVSLGEVGVINDGDGDDDDGDDDDGDDCDDELLIFVLFDEELEEPAAVKSNDKVNRAENRINLMNFEFLNFEF